MKKITTVIMSLFIAAGCASTAPAKHNQNAAPAQQKATAPAPSAAKAGVSGEWLLEVQTEAGSGSPTFTFEQKGETLTGYYQGMFGSAPVTGTVKGDKIEFSCSVDASGDKATLVYSGTVSGNSMKGDFKLNGSSSLTGTFTGVRK